MASPNSSEIFDEINEINYSAAGTQYPDDSTIGISTFDDTEDYDDWSTNGQESEAGEYRMEELLAAIERLKSEKQVLY